MRVKWEKEKEDIYKVCDLCEYLECLCRELEEVEGNYDLNKVVEFCYGKIFVIEKELKEVEEMGVYNK